MDCPRHSPDATVLAANRAQILRERHARHDQWVQQQQEEINLRVPPHVRVVALLSEAARFETIHNDRALAALREVETMMIHPSCQAALRAARDDALAHRSALGLSYANMIKDARQKLQLMPASMGKQQPVAAAVDPESRRRLQQIASEGIACFASHLPWSDSACLRDAAPHVAPETDDLTAVAFGIPANLVRDIGRVGVQLQAAAAKEDDDNGAAASTTASTSSCSTPSLFFTTRSIVGLRAIAPNKSKSVVISNMREARLCRDRCRVAKVADAAAELPVGITNGVDHIDEQPRLAADTPVPHAQAAAADCHSGARADQTLLEVQGAAFSLPAAAKRLPSAAPAVKHQPQQRQRHGGASLLLPPSMFGTHMQPPLPQSVVVGCSAGYRPSGSSVVVGGAAAPPPPLCFFQPQGHSVSASTVRASPVVMSMMSGGNGMMAAPRVSMMHGMLRAGYPIKLQA